jgi:outer membrane usher protein
MSFLKCARRSVLFGSLILFFLFSTLNAFSEEAVPLKVVINGEDMGEFFVVLAPDGDVWIKRSDLGKNNLIEGLGKDVKVNGDTYVSLKSIPDLTFLINEKEVSLEIQAAPHLFKEQNVNASYTRPYDVSYPKDTSAFFNYGLLYNSEDTSFDLATEVGLHFQDFLGISTFNYHKSEHEEKIVRLITSLQTDNRENLRTMILGDFSAISGIFGSAPLLGGVNISKNFQIDPYYLRYPSLSLNGALLAPSEVGVYVNDMLIKRETLPPGEFLFKNIPGEVGLGSTKIIIRDIYGLERVITQPFYYSDRLLKPGLQEYSYSIGFLRENFGEESFSYGDPALLAFHNYGISNNLKAGYTMELSKDVMQIGPTASVLLPKKAGVLDLAFSVSKSQHETGFGGFLGHSFRSKYVDTVLSLTSFTEDFSSIAVKPSDDKPVFQLLGAIGLRDKRLGSLTTQYSTKRFHIGPDTSVLSLSYNKVLTKRATFFATASRSEVEGLDTKNELFCGLNIYFGRDVSGLFSYTSRDGENIKRATVTKSLPVGPGFGFTADVENHDEHNNRTDVLGEIRYQNDYGIYGIGYNRSNEREFFQASVSGGIGIIDGSIFLSRPLYDSFAKVKVDGVEGVRIYADGNVATRTNSKGEAIIPFLRSFQDNKIDIENEDIPIDYSIPSLTRYVNPSLRSGAIVNFDVKKIQGFVGNIYIRMNGEQHPAASTVIKIHLKDTVLEGVVGTEGEFYFENLPPGQHTASMQYKGKECNFVIIVPETEEIMVNLGKIVYELKK